MIFVTGAANVGKTSLTNLLKEQLPQDKFDIHDIDEADLWGDNSNYEAWRDAKIEYWLKQSIENKRKGIETILSGIIYPNHVVKSPSYKAAMPIKYIFLDADPDTFRERFYKGIERRINRHIEISNEIKTEVEDIDNKQILNTTDLPMADISDLVVKILE